MTHVLRGNVHTFNMSAVFKSVYEKVTEKMLNEFTETKLMKKGDLDESLKSLACVQNISYKISYS